MGKKIRVSNTSGRLDAVVPGVESTVLAHLSELARAAALAALGSRPDGLTAGERRLVHRQVDTGQQARVRTDPVSLAEDHGVSGLPLMTPTAQMAMTGSGGGSGARPVNNPRHRWLFETDLGVDVAVNQAELMAHLVVRGIDLT